MVLPNSCSHCYLLMFLNKPTYVLYSTFKKIAWFKLLESIRIGLMSTSRNSYCSGTGRGPGGGRERENRAKFLLLGRLAGAGGERERESGALHVLPLGPHHVPLLPATCLHRILHCKKSPTYFGNPY